MVWWRNTFAPTSLLGLSASGRWAPAACALLLHRLLLKAELNGCFPAACPPLLMRAGSCQYAAVAWLLQLPASWNMMAES